MVTVANLERVVSNPCYSRPRPAGAVSRLPGGLPRRSSLGRRPHAIPSEGVQEPGLILTLAAALGAALVFGYLTQRLGLSPIVGYLIAGVAIGPHTPGFIGNAELAEQLAEIGVILL